jgi:hypothetical protein
VDDLTRRRLVHNEQVFKAINEEVREAHARPEDDKIAFLCECADRSCTEKVRLTADEYRQVRADSNRYVVATGHVVPELEHVVERHGDYEVVQKDEQAA